MEGSTPFWDAWKTCARCRNRTKHVIALVQEFPRFVIETRCPCGTLAESEEVKDDNLLALWIFAEILNAIFF